MDQRFYIFGVEIDSCFALDTFGGVNARVLAGENLEGNCKCSWNTY